MNIIIIDNYDSFTYNLDHMVKALGAQTRVLRNDQFRMEELEEADKLLLSPGPGVPDEAGLLLDVIRTYAGRKPILGICLGEQAIGEVYGARLTNLASVYHGVQTTIHLQADEPLFRGLPQDIAVGRYHSWVVSREGLPACLEVTATDDEGHIMAIRHRSLDVRGLQFHPESILTPDGETILRNWLSADEQEGRADPAPTVND